MVVSDLDLFVKSAKSKFKHRFYINYFTYICVRLVKLFRTFASNFENLFPSRYLEMIVFREFENIKLMNLHFLE